MISLQAGGTPNADEFGQTTLVLPDLDVHWQTRNIGEVALPNVGHTCPESLGVVRVKEVAARGWVDDVDEELVDVRHVSLQLFRG